VFTISVSGSAAEFVHCWFSIPEMELDDRGNIIHRPFYPRVCVEVCGVLKSQTWKCWKAPSGELTWEAIGFIPALTSGRDISKKNFRINKFFSQDVSGWRERLGDEDTTFDEHFFPPFRSLARKRVVGIDNKKIHDTASVSTYGLVSLFTFVATHRTGDRSACGKNCLVAFMRNRLPAFDIKDVKLGELTREARPLCTHHAENGWCSHLRACVDKFTRADNAINACVHLMCDASEGFTACDSLAWVHYRVIKMVAELIEQTFDDEVADERNTPICMFVFIFSRYGVASGSLETFRSNMYDIRFQFGAI
jgi:hypothetical protein